MRVFIALNIPQKTKDNLERSSRQFADFATKGNYIPKDNYHITVHFLGEVAPSDIIYIQSAMDSVKDLPAPNLSVTQFVSMRASDVVCAKLRNSKQLAEIHEQLGSKLEQSGFAVEHRAYRPHITLIRKHGFNLPFSEVVKNVKVYNMPFDAPELVLYESTLSKDGATYNELYKVTLHVTEP